MGNSSLTRHLLWADTSLETGEGTSSFIGLGGVDSLFLLGTIVNSIAILLGTTLGMLLPNIPEGMKKTIMQGLSLTIIVIGLSMALSDQKDILIIIVSMVIGALMGEWLDIEGWLTRIGKSLEVRAKRFGGGQIGEAFVVTSLIFCVGSMAIVGAIESGVHDNQKILYAKSLLDGFSAIVFSSTLGIGVAFSAVAVFLYEGSIALLSFLAGGVMNDARVIAGVTATGGLLIVAIGLNILGVTKIAVGNLLPAMFVAGFLCFAWPLSHAWWLAHVA